MREAWEECGARVELVSVPFELPHPSGEHHLCFLARLLALEPSPEGRPRLWIDPRDQEWQGDRQIAPALLRLRERGWL